SCGVPTPNPSSSIRIGRDHWQTIRTLNLVSISTPTTLAGADPEALAATAEMHLGFPLVVKKRASRQGVGVIQCRHRDHLEAILDSMWRVGDEVVVQEYIECSGVSYRLLVVGNDVVAAACFESSAGEWRSNAARGASTTAHSPNLVQREMACDAAKALGLGVCGVDLLEGPEGPIVCEVNPSPGFLHLEKATGFDVAGLLVDQLMQM
ncbi:MAG: RimK family alpha-L-glutamate ligase, partial [bacterium]|nr:RimK family alpha-L-glutamate ligase [bacterium]